MTSHLYIVLGEYVYTETHLNHHLHRIRFRKFSHSFRPNREKPNSHNQKVCLLVNMRRRGRTIRSACLAPGHSRRRYTHLYKAGNTHREREMIYKFCLTIIIIAETRVTSVFVRCLDIWMMHLVVLDLWFIIVDYFDSQRSHIKYTHIFLHMKIYTFCIYITKRCLCLEYAYIHLCFHNFEDVAQGKGPFV